MAHHMKDNMKDIIKAVLYHLSSDKQHSEKPKTKKVALKKYDGAYGSCAKRFFEPRMRVTKDR